MNQLLFVADNLACFPFQSQDEPLFIMHHIDITLSVSGSNLLQSFKEVGAPTQDKNISHTASDRNLLHNKSTRRQGDHKLFWLIQSYTELFALT